VLALVVAAGRGTADPLATARERLAAVPVALRPILTEPALDPFGDDDVAGVVLPPGVGVRDASADAATARATAWDALLARLGATPRERAAAPAGDMSS
jgi:hypothetical protein